MKLADDVKLVREVFQKVFELVPKYYGPAKRPRGVHDGTEGVQWNAGIPESGGVYLGVNLEGKEYDSWPIARLISSELDDPKVFEAMKPAQRLDDVELIFWRDVWGPGGRRLPNVKEHVIAPTPITLDRLTGEIWRKVLEEARGCLNAEKNLLGRGKLSLTLVRKDGHEESKTSYVSPHLQFRVGLWQHAPPTFAEACRRMSEARSLLQPLRRWAKDTSAKRETRS